MLQSTLGAMSVRYQWMCAHASRVGPRGRRTGVRPAQDDARLGNQQDPVAAVLLTGISCQISAPYPDFFAGRPCGLLQQLQLPGGHTAQSSPCAGAVVSDYVVTLSIRPHLITPLAAAQLLPAATRPLGVSSVSVVRSHPRLQQFARQAPVYGSSANDRKMSSNSGNRNATSSLNCGSGRYAGSLAARRGLYATALCRHFPVASSAKI